MRILLNNLVREDVRHNTSEIQNAIDKCSLKGGGIVEIPEGEYICGTIELKSNVTVELTPGSCLKASSNLDDYRTVDYYHEEFHEFKSFIFALGANNIAITGKGTIDLNDEAFMNFDKYRAFDIQLDRLSAEQLNEAVCLEKDRPSQPIFIQNCQTVDITEVKVINAPCWTISISESSNIKIDKISVINKIRVPNSDGIHISACKDVIISNSHFVCGDDCIALTCITNPNKINERITITNCNMQSCSSAIRIGHESGKVRNVTISNIVIHDSNRGFSIFSGKDGFVENVAITNIICDTRIYAGAWWGKGEPVVICAYQQGSIRKVVFSNIIIKCENGINMKSFDSCISSIYLRDINIEIGRGHNFELFGHCMDFLPALFEELPENIQPYLYSEGINDLNIENIKATNLCGDNIIVDKIIK